MANRLLGSFDVAASFLWVPATSLVSTLIGAEKRQYGLSNPARLQNRSQRGSDRPASLAILLLAQCGHLLFGSRPIEPPIRVC